MNIANFDDSAKSPHVEELLHHLEKNIHSLAQRTVATIRDEVEAFRELPLNVHLSDNVVNLSNLITGLIRFTPPDEQSMNHASFMGKQRALVQLPLAAAIEGYHIGYALVWKEMLTLAQASDNPHLKEEISGYVTPLWTWFQSLSSAFSDAYIAADASLRATQSDLKAIIYESMRSEVQLNERSILALQEIGFVPEKAVQVMVGAPLAPEVLPAVSTAMAAIGGAVTVIATAPETVVISEVGVSDQVAGLLQSVGQVHVVGIGGEQEDALLYAVSYREARRALTCAHEGRPVADYSDVWLIAWAREHYAEAPEQVTEGMSVARSHKQLAQTVAAFTQHRFSITATARSEHVHPNTVKYRLGRWQQLTGWDVYTTDGLMNSVACLELLDLAPIDADQKLA